MKPAISRMRSAVSLAGFTAITFCAPLAGIFSPPGEWYASLHKPVWNPPAWVFGPVWTTLYLLMAVSAWMVWKREGFSRAIRLYFIQLALNAAWSPVFFAAKQPGWAFVTILALWLAIVLTARDFLRADKLAGVMWIPYLLWVTFAAFLNFTLWRMNPGG